MTDEIVDLAGLEFRCRLDGPAGAPWMVFSNSLLTNVTMWDEQVAVFADRFRILRYDQRGHGGTSVPPEATSIEQLADDVSALLAHFAVQDAVFIGISMGAATGLCVAGRGEKRIGRLIACDVGAFSPPSAPAAWDERIALARDAGMPALATATLARWFTPATILSGVPMLDRVRAMIEATPPDGFIACARALQDYNLTVLLPGISVPTLLVAGEKDGAIPEAMRALQLQIWGAQYEEIPASGHLPNLERPDMFMASIQTWLNK
jgi:3-oxoadipate enol-lactonase